MTMRSVTDDIKIYLPATLELVIVAAIIQYVQDILEFCNCNQKLYELLS